MIIGLFQKKSKRWGLRTYFFGKNPPEIFRFITLPLEILDKTKLYLCEFCESVVTLEIPRSKMKT